MAVETASANRRGSAWSSPAIVERSATAKLQYPNWRQDEIVLVATCVASVILHLMKPLRPFRVNSPLCPTQRDRPIDSLILSLILLGHFTTSMYHGGHHSKTSEVEEPHDVSILQWVFVKLKDQLYSS